ncbi:MAG: hypothetical protein R3F20_14345 [Planctomycetota bacterium]
MIDRSDLSRLIESYAIGDAAEHERRIVEDALAGRDDRLSAAEAEEMLRFERRLHEVLDDPRASGDVADQVLDRLFRRPTRQDRRDFRRDLAAEALAEARERGRITERIPGRRYYFERPGMLRAAAILVALGGLMFFSLRDFTRPEASPGPRLYQAEVAPIADIAYVKAGDGRPESVAVPKQLDRVFAGASIETREDQRAVVVLARNAGRLVVHPGSRIRLLRQIGSPQLRVYIERGGIWADLKGHDPIFVDSGSNYGGRLVGRGEVVLASNTLGRGRGLVPPDLDRSFVVTVQGPGEAVFRNGADEISIADDELGVIGETSLVKLPRGARPIARIPDRPWSFEGVVEDPRAVALRIGGEVYTREDLARETMRVFASDLVEMFVRSSVVHHELRRRGLSIPPALRQLARQHVGQDELMQVAPLRSQSAVEERAFQVAGLLTVALNGRPPSAGRLSVGQICETTWSALARQIQVDWRSAPGAQGFRVRLNGATVGELDLEPAWAMLRRYLRPAEVDALLDDFVERHVIRTWLESQGGTWPENLWRPDPDPARRAAQELLVKMSGVTIPQFVDRLAVRQVVLSSSPAPSEADVDRFLEEESPAGRRVAFEHFIFPFVGDDGGVATAADVERAGAAAELAARALRAGRTSGFAAEVGSEKGLWQSRWDFGPRPWWDEIYGADFRPGVLRLSEDQVGDPVRGREAYHVVRMRRIQSVDEDPIKRRQIARQLMMLETARTRIDQLLRSVPLQRAAAEDLLR